ncbi:MAG: hypothetical protein AAGE18_13465 [Pseudomonadota bacterium]
MSMRAFTRAATVLATALLFVATPTAAGVIFNANPRGSAGALRTVPAGADFPVVLVGPIFDGMSADAFAAMLEARGRFGSSAFVPAPPETSGTRIVFAFGRSSPSGLCDTTSPLGGGVANTVSASVCTGNQQLSRATMRRGRNLDRDLSDLLHILLTKRSSGSAL